MKPKLSPQARFQYERAKWPNTGNPWTPELLEELRGAMLCGSSLSQLCDRFQRNPNGLSTQLEKMGLVRRVWNPATRTIEVHQHGLWAEIDYDTREIKNG